MMKRRDFVKYGVGGLATLVVGSKMPWLMDNPAYAAVQTQDPEFHHHRCRQRDGDA